mgnify:CR=1 FL=1
MHLWFIPSVEEVDEAAKALMGLSNGMPPKGSEGIQNAKQAATIRKMLRIHHHE